MKQALIGAGFSAALAVIWLTASAAPIQGQADAGLPAGTILAFAGAKIPDGFLAANGDVVDPAKHPRLCEAIAGVYSTSSEPRSTCRLPNLNGRTLLGSGRYNDTVDGLVTRELGQALGAASHRLTLDEMVPHQHDTAGAVHPPDGYYQAGGARPVEGNMTPKSPQMASGRDVVLYFHPSGYRTTRVPDKNEANTFSTLSPAVVVTFIIKT